MIHRLRSSGAALALAFLLVSPASAFGPDEGVTRGEKLFADNECADCHVRTREPGQPTIALRYLADRFTEASLAAFLSAPPRPMPNAGLSLEDRQALASYLLATYP